MRTAARRGWSRLAPGRVRSELRAVQVAGPGPVDIEVNVVDVRGRLVRQILHGVRVSGTYELHWDGNDRAGIPTARGQYLAVLRANREPAGTRRIIRSR